MIYFTINIQTLNGVTIHARKSKFNAADMISNLVYHNLSKQFKV